MDVAQQRDIHIDRPRPSLALAFSYGRRCRAMAKSARCLTMNLCDFDTTIGRISDGEFTGFVRVMEAGSVVLALSATLARKTNTNWQLTLTATIHGSQRQRQRCWKCRCRPRTWNTFVDLSAVVGVLMMDPAVRTIHGLGNCWHPERTQRRWQPDWG